MFSPDSCFAPPFRRLMLRFAEVSYVTLMLLRFHAGDATMPLRRRCCRDGVATALRHTTITTLSCYGYADTPMLPPATPPRALLLLPPCLLPLFHLRYADLPDAMMPPRFERGQLMMP